MKFSARTTLAILVVMTLAGAAYMSFGVLDMGPTKQVNRLTLLLNSSGGLMPTSEVTMRGIKVGRVTGIQTTNSGLAVSMDVDRKYPVPADSMVSVENLSAAGEQYIDFRPKMIAPPYFTDGAVIPAERVAPIVTASDLLTKANVLFTALNLDQIHGIINDMSAAFKGNDETIDSLAVTAGLTAKVIRDDKELLGTLFSNVSTFTTNLGRAPCRRNHQRDRQNTAEIGAGLLAADPPDRDPVAHRHRRDRPPGPGRDPGRQARRMARHAGRPAGYLRHHPAARDGTTARH